MEGAAQLWRDRDKRRAALASLLLHAALLLGLALLVQRPDPVPLESFIVIEVGTPAEAETTEPAAAADAPAPDAPTPQVASEAPGAPAAREAPSPDASAPEPQVESAQPPAPPPRTAPEASADPAPETPAAPDVAAAPPVPADPAPSEPAQSPPAPTPPAPSAAVAPPRPAAPAAVAPAPAVEPLPRSPAPPLPEIAAPEIEPRPLAEPIEIPAPRPSASVAEPRDVAVAPSAEVAEARAVPAPDARAEVTEARPVPAPDASASVAEARPVPTPEPSASVAAPRDLAVTPSASVADARSVPSPEASASVAEARAIPNPGAQASVAAPRAVPSPEVTASAGRTRDVAIAPQLSVPTSTRIPQPQVRTEVRAPETAAGAPATAPEDPRAGASDLPADRASALPTGGNADVSGQPGSADGASAEALGRAASPDGTDTPSGAPPAPVPYSEARARPVAVLLDNANGYPQAGIGAASFVAEMPVEGGLTRLMALFDRTDPGEVGPIRSARDYFVELAADFDAVLVHDGGSPGALAAIGQLDEPTLDAFRRGELFSRSAARSAPYNLYSGGGSLREAIARLQLDRRRTVQGTRFRPAGDAPGGTEVDVRFGATYRSGFRYVPELDRYRWVRNGVTAVDASDDAVLTEAVVIARIDARTLPNDTEGRLYIPLRPGPATLLLRGRAVEGTWQPRDGVGVIFVAADGREVDLRPFRTWTIFAPAGADVALR